MGRVPATSSLAWRGISLTSNFSSIYSILTQACKHRPLLRSPTPYVFCLFIITRNYFFLDRGIMGCPYMTNGSSGIL